MASTFVRGTGHANEGLLEPFNSADAFVVLSASLGKVSAGGGEDGVTKAAGQVRATIGDNATGNAMPAHDVFHEDVQNLGGRGVAMYRYGFDPTGQGVDEHDKFRGTSALVGIVVVRLGHGKDVGVQDVERVLTNGRSNRATGGERGACRKACIRDRR